MLEKKTKTAHLIIPGSKEETVAYCISEWISLAKRSIEEHGAFYVALSGGSTPKAIYNSLAEKHKETIDWEKVHIFWSDERSVPPDNDESNYAMAMNNGLAHLPIPEDNIHRMKAEDNIGEGATAYEKTIAETLSGKPFDLIMLGMGDDGHTASLFPGTSALQEKERWVVANYVSDKDTYRMTMTFPLLNASLCTTFYVLGSSKADMVHNIFVEGGDFPAAHVGSEKHPAQWILDEDAGKKTLDALS